MCTFPYGYFMTNVNFLKVDCLKSLRLFKAMAYLEMTGSKANCKDS